jgi:nucleoid-associated protein YgaU
MAKISQLPLVTDPDGTETFVVLKDGMAQRVPGAALIGAAGDVSLEQVQAAAAQAAANAQEAQGAAQSAAQAASAAQTLADAASTKADATAAALAALVLPAPSPYVIGFAFIAPLAASEVFGFHVAGAAFTWPANFAGAFVHAVGVPPGAALVLALKVDGASVASFTIAPDGTITASNQGAIPVAKGALITLEGPAAPDANAAKTGLTLIGTRT